MNDLCTKGAAELARMIASREVTSAEVVDAHLSRIAEVNPDLNAVTVTLADEARIAAAAVDRAVAAGAPLGPLAGVPFSIKENIDVAGSATTWGVAALAGQIASTDAPIVARFREAGAIPLARTNMPDFAFRWDTASGRAGRTRNPWDQTRTPGGSSGGEAAALASGMTPLGLGNDLGGSLRVPSQMCGTAALRPSRGRVADGAVTQPFPPSMAVQMTNSQGPMARHVSDLRMALGILSAPDPHARDPRWVPAPLQGPRVDGPIRVAVVRDPGGIGVDTHVRAGIDRAADWLADAGYEVIDAEPPQILEAAAAWADAIWADIGTIWPGMEPVAGADELEFVQACLAQGVFKPVDQGGSLRPGSACTSSARPGHGSSATTPSCSHRSAASARGSWVRTCPASDRSSRRCAWSCRSTSSDCLPAQCPSAPTTACPRAYSSSVPASGRICCWMRPRRSRTGLRSSRPSSREWRCLRRCRRRSADRSGGSRVAMRASSNWPAYRSAHSLGT